MPAPPVSRTTQNSSQEVDNWSLSSVEEDLNEIEGSSMQNVETSNYTAEQRHEDYEHFVRLCQTRNAKGLKQLRKKIEKFDKKGRRGTINYRSKTKQDGPETWNNMVLQGNEDHETILMMMLCSRHEKRDKDKFGAPKKITQCSTIHALKELLKRLSTRQRSCLIRKPDPLFSMSILNELAEHRRWDVLRFLLEQLNGNDRLQAVLDRNHATNYPESLYTIAMDKEHTLYKMLKCLKVLPSDIASIRQQCNPPHHMPVDPETGMVGTALVLNMAFREENATQDTRTGGDSDHDKIMRALKRLHFKVDALEENITKQELLDHIRQFEMVGSVFSLVIQTHGVLGKLALSDTSIDISQLLTEIDKKLDAQTIKVVFLQHCRASEEGAGIDSQERTPHQSLPGHNWLLGYACGYGLRSARNSYIRHLAETLSSIKHGRCLLDVLSEVHGKIKVEFPDQIPQYLTSLSATINLTPLVRKGTAKLRRDSSISRQGSTGGDQLNLECQAPGGMLSKKADTTTVGTNTSTEELNYPCRRKTMDHSSTEPLNCPSQGKPRQGTNVESATYHQATRTRNRGDKLAVSHNDTLPQIPPQTASTALDVTVDILASDTNTTIEDIPPKLPPRLNRTWHNSSKKNGAHKPTLSPSQRGSSHTDAGRRQFISCSSPRSKCVHEYEEEHHYEDLPWKYNYRPSSPHDFPLELHPLPSMACTCGLKHIHDLPLPRPLSTPFVYHHDHKLPPPLQGPPFAGHHTHVPHELPNSNDRDEDKHKHRLFVDTGRQIPSLINSKGKCSCRDCESAAQHHSSKD